MLVHQWYQLFLQFLNATRCLRRGFLLLLYGMFLWAPLTVSAQEASFAALPSALGDIVSSMQMEETVPLQVQVPTEVKSGRNTIFRISNWESLPLHVRNTVQIRWEFGDGTVGEGREVVHSFVDPGQYTVRVTVRMEEETREDVYEYPVFVYDRLYVILTDSDWNVYREPLVDTARDRSIFLSFIDLRTPSSSLVGTESTLLLNRFKEHVQDASFLFVGEDGRQALNALSAFKKENPSFDFSAKRIIVSTKSSQFIFQRIASRSLSSIGARDLLLREGDLLSALYDLITAESEDVFVQSFVNRPGVQVVDKRTETPGITNFISYYINEAISRGVPGDLFLFILLLPIIVTIISFFRQVVGLDTLGIFMPTVLTLSFIIIGLRFAIIILLLIILVNMLTRTVLKRFYMSYAPKMSIVVSVSALAMLALIIVGVYFDMTFGIDMSQNSRAVLSIFPMVIMVMLAEQIMNIQNAKGVRSTIRIIFEMVFTCILTYGLVTMEILQVFTFAYPEIVVVLVLVCDVLLGRFSGLRFLEYLRFRDLFFHETEE